MRCKQLSAVPRKLSQGELKYLKSHPFVSSLLPLTVSELGFKAVTLQNRQLSGGRPLAEGWQSKNSPVLVELLSGLGSHTLVFYMGDKNSLCVI